MALMKFLEKRSAILTESGLQVSAVMYNRIDNRIGGLRFPRPHLMY